MQKRDTTSIKASSETKTATKKEKRAWKLSLNLWSEVSIEQHFYYIPQTLEHNANPMEMTSDNGNGYGTAIAIAEIQFAK